MKKKLMTGLAAGALALGFVQAQPAEAYVDPGVDVSLYGLEQNSDRVFMFYEQVEDKDMFFIRVGENYYNIASGIFPNEKGMLTLEKENYPALKDLSLGDKVYVEVVEPAKGLNKTGRTKVFEASVQRTSYVPTSMTLDQAILSRGGANQDIGILFDENYKPGFADKVVYEALDKDGNAISGSKKERRVTSAALQAQKDQTQLLKYAVSPPTDAYSYRISFVSGGRSLDQFTFEVPVGDYFGTPAQLDIRAHPIVSLGQVVTPEIILIDEEGNERNVSKEASIGFNSNFVIEDENNPGSFIVRQDAANRGKIFSMAASYAGQADAFTFEIGESASKAKLTPAMGTLGQEVKVDFQLLDSNGDNAALSWQPTEANVRFLNSDNPAAAITATFDDLENLDVDGGASMTLSSNQAVNAEMLVTLKNNSQSVEYSAGSFSFKAPSQERINVIMGIGSSQLIVNGKEVGRMDTAPLIRQERTFVPLRAMAEAFGAQVDYVEDKNHEITITLGDKVIVMHSGSQHYTINGKAATMDVAPYINRDDRTMVPIRFAAEGLGFTVDANFNADGTTANVVIGNY